MKQATQLNPKNKCEKQGFIHAWEDSTPNIVYATNPPRYPDKQQTCLNCNLTRVFREKREAWIEYSDGIQRETGKYCNDTHCFVSIKHPHSHVKLVCDGKNWKTDLTTDQKTVQLIDQYEL